MVRSLYIYTATVVLILLILPIVFLFSMRFFNLFPAIDIWIVYFAVFCSGPLLLVYGFLARLSKGRELLSVIALSTGAVWIGFEVIILIRGIFM